MCGTNDVSTKKKVEKISNEFDSLLKIAKSRCDKVHLSSVTPRSDDRTHDDKVAKLNELLAQLAPAADVTFIDNDKNFRYRDGSADESLVSPIDRVHLSDSGSRKLLENLGLCARAKAVSGTVPSIQRQTTDKMHAPSKDPPIALHNPQEAGGNPDDSSTTIKFRGPHNSLSNFYGAQLRMWGLTFPTNEHAYQYRRAMENGEYATAERIRQASHPRVAQQIAKNFRTDERWKGMKQSVMYELLEEKSRQCSAFRHDLVASGNATLLEDTSHEFWARGQQDRGLNVLGRLLMTLRQNLPPSNKYSNPQVSAQQIRDSQRKSPLMNEQQVRCYYCGERSHTKKACRHAAPLRCYNCSELGHKRKVCPQHHEN